MLQVFNVSTIFQLLCYAYHLFLPHTIDNHVGMCIAENGLANTIFPIVVMGKTAQ